MSAPATNATGYSLLPTPTRRDDRGPARRKNRQRPNGLLPNALLEDGTIDDYPQAVARHTELMGRKPPEVQVGPHLSGHFVEWMMGLDQGWVTNIIESRRAQLRLLGNGVVPKQALAALQQLDPVKP